MPFVSCFSLVCCRTLKSTPTPRCGLTWIRTGRPQAISEDDAVCLLYIIYILHHRHKAESTFYKHSNIGPVVVFFWLGRSLFIRFSSIFYTSCSAYFPFSTLDPPLLAEFPGPSLYNYKPQLCGLNIAWKTVMSCRTALLQTS